MKEAAKSRGIKEQRISSLGQVTCVLILSVVTVLAFSYFMYASNQHVTRQNAVYMEGAAHQITRHLEDRMVSAQSNISTIAYLAAQSMPAEGMTQELLAVLEEQSSFDYVEFTNAEGTCMNATAGSANVSDRDYFIQGMRGGTGVCIVQNSRITHETLAIFYAPIYQDGAAAGVLTGVYRQSSMENLINANFFNVTAQSYICAPDGTVIYAGGSEKAENLLEDLRDRVSPNAYQQVLKAFQDREVCNVAYTTGGSTAGNAVFLPMQYNDWILILAFPASVFAEMTKTAQTVSIRLLAVLAVLLLYFAIQMLIYHRKRKKLEQENQDISDIVNSVTHLFNRFLVVDLKKDTYKYLKGAAPGLPRQGRYSQLLNDLSAAQQNVGGRGRRLLNQKALQESLQADTPYLQYEYRANQENGTWENVSALCIRRERGLAEMVLLAVQDVTELKTRELESQAALQEALEMAESASRAKSDFLTHMSHDIRTPMNAIMGMTSLAVMHIDEKDRVLDCLNKITVSSKHLLALINNVLDMSKIESGKLSLAEQPFDLAEMLRNVVTIMNPQIAAKGQTLQTDAPCLTHTAVIGDSLRLRQALVNILGNSVKFTPAGGTIFLSVREEPSVISGWGCYEFVVKDTGVGMEQSFLDRIFEPFSRSQDSDKQHIEGSGLGMAITNNIVRMMNGSIKVESQPGAGSTFTVQLYLILQNTAPKPLDAAEPQDAAALETDQLLEQDYGGRRVLLAEDNELNREIAAELLSSVNLQVEMAHDGQEAVEMTAEKPAGYYSLIFMDIQMPRKNGYEAAAAIRAIPNREDLQQIPIVAMSADAFADDIRRAKEAGMVDHVSKPIEIGRLLEALARWLGPDENAP